MNFINLLRKTNILHPIGNKNGRLFFWTSNWINLNINKATKIDFPLRKFAFWNRKTPENNQKVFLIVDVKKQSEFSKRTRGSKIARITSMFIIFSAVMYLSIRSFFEEEEDPPFSEYIEELLISMEPFPTSENERKRIAFEKAKDLVEIENFKDAVEAWDAYLRMDPYSFWAHYQRAICFEMLGEDEKALEAYNIFIQILPDKTPIHHLRKALILIRMNRDAEAKECLNIILNSKTHQGFKDFSQLLLIEHLLLGGKSKLVEAKQAIASAISTSQVPLLKFAMCTYLLRLLVREGDYQQAAKTLSFMEKLSPENMMWTPVVVALGSTFCHLGYFEEASIAFMIVLKRQSHDVKLIAQAADCVSCMMNDPNVDQQWFQRMNFVTGLRHHHVKEIYELLRKQIEKNNK